MRRRRSDDYATRTFEPGSCRILSEKLQGYAARGGLLLFVSRVYKLDVQGYAARGWIFAIRSSVAFSQLSAPRDADTAKRYANSHFARRMTVQSLLRDYKRKNTTRGGVFLLWCTFRDSNPGPTD